MLGRTARCGARTAHSGTSEPCTCACGSQVRDGTQQAHRSPELCKQSEHSNRTNEAQYPGRRESDEQRRIDHRTHVHSSSLCGAVLCAFSFFSFFSFLWRFFSLSLPSCTRHVQSDTVGLTPPAAGDDHCESPRLQPRCSPCASSPLPCSQPQQGHAPNHGQQIVRKCPSPRPRARSHAHARSHCLGTRF